MANENVKSQQEYNDLLDMTQSMLGKMSNAMSELNDKTDKRNKKLSEQVSITQQIIDSVEDLEDLEAAVSLIQQNTTNISKQNFGVNNKLVNTFLAQMDAVAGILRVSEQTQKVFERVDDITSKTTNSFSGAIDDIMGKIENIPVIGGALSSIFEPFANRTKKLFEDTASNFTSNFKSSFMAARANGQSFTKSLASGLANGFTAIRGILASINPIVLGIGLIAAAAYISYQRFQELQAAAQTFRDETGLLNSQMQQTYKNIQLVSRDFSGLGVSVEDVAKSAAAFTNTFDGLKQPAKETLESLVVMNKNFGVSVSDAAELNKLFQNMGGLTEAQAQSLSMSVVEMSKLAGVAPSKVISDLAKNSGEALKYFRGSPTELAKSAVSLAKMGSSLQSAAKSAEALLDFESGITNELEAGALLGARINLDKARAAAFAGNQYEQEKAIMEQMMQLGDISTMDVYKKEALAKATGKEVDELINMQRIQKQFGSLDESRLAAAHALIDAGKDISKLTTEDLQAQTDKMARQQEMQSLTDRLSNKFSEMGTAFMDMLLPIGEFVMPILVDIADVLGAVLVPAFKVVGSVLKVVGSILGSIWSLISSIVKPIIEVGMAVVEAIISPFMAAFDVISNFFDNVSSVMKSISDFVTENLIAPFQSFVNTVGNFGNKISSLLGFGGSSETVSDSVDDGVIQNGKVISTNPLDTIIATKTPEELAGASAPIDYAGIDTLIQEIKGLRTDLNSGKIAVYMDGGKVTSKITKVIDKVGGNSYGAA